MIIQNFEITDINDNFDSYSFLNGKKCFVFKSIVGDIVDIEIIKETKEFYIANIIRIVKKSNYREDYKCQYYNMCGGCSMQHFNKEYYYKIKENSLKNILKDTQLNFEKIEILKIEEGKRRRINLKYEHGKYGFFKENTNELIQIDKCLNVEENINKFIENFKNINLHGLENVDIISIDNEIGINLIFNKTPKITEFERLNLLKERVNYINYKIKDENFYISIFKIKSLFLEIGKFKLELTNDCFLQATKKSQDILIDIITKELEKYKKIADLYCGIGAYSFPLSIKSRVSAYEGEKNMVKIFKKNIATNKSNINIFEKDLFNQPLITRELNEFDAIVINPPRNGSENQCKFLAKSNLKKIIYVSCNPKTLARDLKLFKNIYEIKKIFMLDQFYWSKHIECVVILEPINNK